MQLPELTKSRRNYKNIPERELTQLHASRELTKAQMKSNKTIIKFNDRYTVLIEESTEEIPETCESKIIIVAYINTL